MVQFNGRGNLEGGHFGIGSRTCTTAIDVGSNVVDLFAVLVGDNRTFGCAGICSQHHSILYRGMVMIRIRRMIRMNDGIEGVVRRK